MEKVWVSDYKYNFWFQCCIPKKIKIKPSSTMSEFLRTECYKSLLQSGYQLMPYSANCTCVIAKKSPMHKDQFSWNVNNFQK